MPVVLGQPGGGAGGGHAGARTAGRLAGGRAGGREVGCLLTRAPGALCPPAPSPSSAVRWNDFQTDATCYHAYGNVRRGGWVGEGLGGGGCGASACVRACVCAGACRRGDQWRARLKWLHTTSPLTPRLLQRTQDMVYRLTAPSDGSFEVKLCVSGLRHAQAPRCSRPPPAATARSAPPPPHPPPSPPCCSRPLTRLRRPRTRTRL